MFLKKANFFETLIPLALEPAAEPMKGEHYVFFTDGFEIFF